MYTVAVEAVFSAIHRLRYRDGTLEPRHGHDWHVRVHFASPELNDLGMVIDFTEAGSALQSVLARLHHTDLNEHQAFAASNPTAELVARFIFDELRKMGFSAVKRVEVTEAPGCGATFE